MRKLGLAVVVCGALCLVAVSARAAPVMPGLPDIAYLFDTVDTTPEPDTTPCFVSGPPDARLQNGPVLSSDTPFAYTGNNSLDFDGGDDYVGVPNDASFNITGDITISIWIKMASDAEVGGLIGKTNGSPTGYMVDYSMYINPAGTLRHNSDAWGGNPVVSGLDVGSAAWQHLAVTRSGNTITFYKNGTAEATSYTVSGAYPNNSLSLLIGVVYMAAPHYFDGLIDEPAIWSRALSANEIEWLSQNSISTIPEPATLGFMALGLAAVFALRKKR